MTGRVLILHQIAVVENIPGDIKKIGPAPGFYQRLTEILAALKTGEQVGPDGFQAAHGVGLALKDKRILTA